MRNIFITSIMLLLVYISFGQDYTYYDSKGNKVPFVVNTKFIFIASNTVNNTANMAALIGSKFTITQSDFDRSIHLLNQTDGTKSLSLNEVFWVEAKLIDSTLSKEDYMSLIKQLNNISGIDYVAPALYTIRQEKLLLSHLFYVQLASQDDINELQTVASQTHTIILGREKYMPDWYMLSAGTGAAGNSIQMAKYFYETGKFMATEPDLIGNAKSTSSCTLSDPMFTDQWYLNNTGQESSDQVGFDIHACDAWTLTTGDPSIIIGLEDNGPSLLHPDLSPNIIGSWDALSASSPSQQYTNGGFSVNHGTGTAGILAAQQNSIGISGVAPNCSLLPVSLYLTGTGFDVIGAAGITYAYQNGASVLSNSWELSSSSPQIDEAISNALTMGRPIDGGADHLGTVVVFASGNNYSSRGGGSISEPGNSNSDVLVVGATSICQERKRYWRTGWGPFFTTGTSCDDGEGWNSQYGTGLDIMAPGVRITTTDNQSSATPTAGNYQSGFDGTSAACPQAAGVAALILSLYPCLRQEQVTTIIEQSAWKINPSRYTYATTSGEPNGLWNNEMGYGFLDAYASLNAVVNFSYLQDEDVTDAQKRYSLNFIQAGYDVTGNLPLGNYTIDNTANVEIKAQQYILFQPGFKTVPGGVMFAHIDAFTGDCTNWVPVFDKKPPTDPYSPAPATDSVTTEVINYNTNGAITMLPNPFKNSFTVNFDVLTDGETTSVKVYDLTGHLLYQQSGVESLGLHSYNIPVNAAASLYIVEACMGGNCVTQKIIKYEED